MVELMRPYISMFLVHFSITVPSLSSPSLLLIFGIMKCSPPLIMPFRIRSDAKIPTSNEINKQNCYQHVASSKRDSPQMLGLPKIKIDVWAGLKRCSSEMSLGLKTVYLSSTIKKKDGSAWLLQFTREGLILTSWTPNRSSYGYEESLLICGRGINRSLPLIILIYANLVPC